MKREIIPHDPRAGTGEEVLKKTLDAQGEAYDKHVTYYNRLLALCRQLPADMVTSTLSYLCRETSDLACHYSRRGEEWPGWDEIE